MDLRLRLYSHLRHFNDKDDLWDAAERGDFTHDSISVRNLHRIQYKKSKEKGCYNLYQSR